MNACKDCGITTGSRINLFCSQTCEDDYFERLTQQHEAQCGSVWCQHCGAPTETRTGDLYTETEYE